MRVITTRWKPLRELRRMRAESDDRLYLSTNRLRCLRGGVLRPTRATASGWQRVVSEAPGHDGEAEGRRWVGYKHTSNRGPDADLFSNGCRGKKRLHSRRQARGWLRVKLKREPEMVGADLMSVYKCKACGTWHIGHDWRRGRHGAGESALLIPRPDENDHGAVRTDRPGDAERSSGGASGEVQATVSAEMRATSVQGGVGDAVSALLWANGDDRAGLNEAILRERRD